MAYGVKYQLIFDTIYTKDKYDSSSATKKVYKASIYKDGYSGTIYDMIGDGSPVVIETQNSDGISYQPTISTKATVNIYKDANFNVKEFFDANATDFYLLIQEGTRTDTYSSGNYVSSSYSWTTNLWTGFFKPVEDMKYGNVDVQNFSMVFIDGLSSIKEKRYFFDNTKQVGFSPYDKVSVKDLIVDCLSRTNLSLPIYINLYYTTPYTSSRYLENMYIPKNSLINNLGEYKTYYDILEALCRRFGLVCYQRNSVWYFTSYGALTRLTSRSYETYNSAGVYQSTITESDSFVTIDATNSFRQLGASLLMSISKPMKSYYLDLPIENVVQEISNGNFGSWTVPTVPDGWNKVSTIAVERTNPTSGLTITSSTSSSSDFEKYIYKDVAQVNAGDVISVAWTQTVQASATPRFIVSFTTVIDSVTYSYYLNNNAEFTQTRYVLGRFSDYSATWNYNTVIPSNGNISVYIYEPYTTSGFTEMDVPYFYMDRFGANSQIYESSSYVNQASNGGSFSSDPVQSTSLGFFMNLDLFYLTGFSDFVFNNAFNVAANSLMGTFVKNDLTFIADGWQRAGAGDYAKIFELVSQDTGIDDLSTQYCIEGVFKSDGYWIGSKFYYKFSSEYSNDTYMLFDFKWDIHNGQQDSKLFKKNYTGTTQTLLFSSFIKSK
jgi:hypothetical protein